MTGENPMVLWGIIIRDVCATASSPKVPPKTRALRLWQFCLYCPGHTTDIQTLWADLKQALRENRETASWIKTQFPPLSPPNFIPHRQNLLMPNSGSILEHHSANPLSGSARRRTRLCTLSPTLVDSSRSIFSTASSDSSDNGGMGWD